MPEGFRSPETAPPAESGYGKRVAEALSGVERALETYKPDTRPGRFLAAMGVVAGLMASGEAHAEATKLFAMETHALEIKTDRLYEYLKLDLAQGEGYTKSLQELNDRRAEWLKERKEEHHYVDLRKDESLLGQYGVTLGDNAVQFQAKRLIDNVWQSESQYWGATPPAERTKNLHNALVFRNGDLAFDIATYKVSFEQIGPSTLDILAYNIDGTIDAYHVQDGALAGETHYDDDMQLPYPDDQKRVKREMRQVHGNVPAGPAGMTD